MQMPFTTEQFLNVFRFYNGSFPFMPIVTYAAGVGTLLLAGRNGQRTDQAILSILGAFWIWNGVAYHIGFFRAVNPAAVIFGGLFLLQGLLLFFAAARGRTVRITLGRTRKARLGSLFVLYAMVIYPILGHLLGHGYPASPVFGMASADPGANRLQPTAPAKRRDWEARETRLNGSEYFAGHRW